MYIVFDEYRLMYIVHLQFVIYAYIAVFPYKFELWHNTMMNKTNNELVNYLYLIWHRPTCSTEHVSPIRIDSTDYNISVNIKHSLSLTLSVFDLYTWCNYAITCFKQACQLVNLWIVLFCSSLLNTKNLNFTYFTQR